MTPRLLLRSRVKRGMAGVGVDHSFSLLSFRSPFARPCHPVLLFTAIQTIEVSVRTKIIKHFALEFGVFWFMEERCATNETRLTANLAVIRKEVSRSHDDFITEHFRKYSEPNLPPVWKTLEVISMGTFSKLYSNFSDATAKHAVAREFGLNHHGLLAYFLKVFLANSNGPSQMLLTTHDINLLNEDFIRRDTIWLTDKDELGETKIVWLSNLGLHKNLSPYNAYKQGKLVKLLFLGSQYINLND